MGRGHDGRDVENLKKAEVMFQERRMDYWLVKFREVSAELRPDPFFGALSAVIAEWLYL
jgi:hypothetical protein